MAASLLDARPGASATELVEDAYPGIEERLRDVATATLLAHLEHLVELGRAHGSPRRRPATSGHASRRCRSDAGALLPSIGAALTAPSSSSSRRRLSPRRRCGRPGAARPSSTTAPGTHATPEEQAAAYAATAAYRTEVATAGQRLESALASSPVDLAGARESLDILRGAVTGTTPSRRSRPRGARLGGAAIAALAPQGATLQLLVSRLLLAPGDIARALQRDAEWIAAEAPSPPRQAPPPTWR